MNFEIFENGITTNHFVVNAINEEQAKVMAEGAIENDGEITLKPLADNIVIPPMFQNCLFDRVTLSNFIR